MPGTRIGGMKAAQKNLANNPNFYKEIGAKGGANGNTGGFAANPELARIAGRKGGMASRRAGSKNKPKIPLSDEYINYIETSNELQLIDNDEDIR